MIILRRLAFYPFMLLLVNALYFSKLSVSGRFPSGSIFAVRTYFWERVFLDGVVSQDCLLLRSAKLVLSSFVQVLPVFFAILLYTMFFVVYNPIYVAARSTQFIFAFFMQAIT